MTDQAARPERERDPWADLLGSALATIALAVRALWRLRLELAIGVPIAVGAFMLAGEPLTIQASAAVLLAAAGRLAWPVLGPALQRAKARREWQQATDALEVTIGRRALGLRPAIRTVPAGEVLEVKVGRGMTVDALGKMEAQLRDTMRVDDVRVDRITGGRARVLIKRRDPFDADPIPWPNKDAEELDVWDPIATSVNGDGETVELTLVDRSGIIIGGEPGAGKSVALTPIIGTAALTRKCRLWLMDGKGNELLLWAACADRWIGPDYDQALELLKHLVAEMQARYVELGAKRKIRRDMGLDLHVLVIDEMHLFLNDTNGTRRKHIVENLRILVSLGRAAGFIVVATTQKPDAKIIPSAIRDLMTFKLALRCATPQASDTILGQGWAHNGADASKILPDQRGVGWLLAEGAGGPELVRGYMLEDEEIEAIAERASQHRIDTDPQDPRNDDPTPTVTPEQVKRANEMARDGGVMGRRPSSSPPEEQAPPPSPPEPAEATLRSVLGVLPDSEAEAMSCSRIERVHGEWPGLKAELQRLCESGAVGHRPGPGRGGVPVYWRKGRDTGISDTGSL